MAEGGDDSDKTEEPTEHKLQEARKKGQEDDQPQEKTPA